MDIGFDWKSRADEAAGGAKAPSGTPDWHGLRARLVAGYAVRRAFGDTPAARGALAAGSFDSGSARALVDYEQSSTGINPVFWADGKRASGMDAIVADENVPGGRG